MDNVNRGLTYILIDIKTAKLMVFTDGSFANNKDLTSQLGFLLVLANENMEKTTGTMKTEGNILHWSSFKCKRVTRSVLASEIYGLVNGFDAGWSISTTLNIITNRMGLPEIPVVVCTDSHSLYECLVKLGTTDEKRLMIDILALRQSYERREINEVRRIEGTKNPANALTKNTPNKALEELVSTNKLSMKARDMWCEEKKERMKDEQSSSWIFTNINL